MRINYASLKIAGLYVLFFLNQLNAKTNISRWEAYFVNALHFGPVTGTVMFVVTSKKFKAIVRQVIFRR